MKIENTSRLKQFSVRKKKCIWISFLLLLFSLPFLFHFLFLFYFLPFCVNFFLAILTVILCQVHTWRRWEDEAHIDRHDYLTGRLLAKFGWKKMELNILIWQRSCNLDLRQILRALSCYELK